MHADSSGTASIFGLALVAPPRRSLGGKRADMQRKGQVRSENPSDPGRRKKWQSNERYYVTKGKASHLGAVPTSLHMISYVLPGTPHLVRGRGRVGLGVGLGLGLELGSTPHRLGLLSSTEYPCFS